MLSDPASDQMILIFLVYFKFFRFPILSGVVVNYHSSAIKLSISATDRVGRNGLKLEKC